MTQLGIFAKYWRAGAVKTRLAATIGEQAASRVYRVFLATLLRRFADVGDRRVLAYAPADRKPPFARLAGSLWTLEAQGGGDLGARMRRYFRSALAHHAQRVVLIGSDCPTLPLHYVHTAFQLLENSPVVLGPTADGGYYLIGASGRVPPVFDGVDWSSRHVWKQTTEQLDAAGWPYSQLPLWYDVDDARDLRRLRDELSADVDLEPARRDLCVAVEKALASQNAADDSNQGA